MITVSKGTLKQKIHEYFQKVEETGEEIIVTHQEIPVLKISPFPKSKQVDEIFADIRGKIKYNGDVMAPETAEWEALC
jgi:antitoxin (DNA-binding transcriptional repressor) of toxin-antitoxin stability system